MFYLPYPVGKDCPRCHQWKPFDQFSKDKTRPFGVRAWCKSCRKIEYNEYKNSHQDVIDAYYERNREKRKAYFKQWRLNNLEHARQQKRKYESMNRERAKARHDKWSKNNREQKREYARNYRRMMHRISPETLRMYTRKRRAQRKRLPDTFTIEEWRYARKWFNGKCAYCDIAEELPPRPQFHADHVIPISDPNCPGTVKENMVPACASCNTSKSGAPVNEWLAKKFGKRKAKAILSRILHYFESLK